MGLYNFKPQFVPLIESGAKTHTIRSIRRYPDKRGSTLYLYTGLRQPGARRLLVAPCVNVQPITITDDHNVIVEGHMLSGDECTALAISDGFIDFAGMMQFWHGKLPFFGNIIHWGKA